MLPCDTCYSRARRTPRPESEVRAWVRLLPLGRGRTTRQARDRVGRLDLDPRQKAGTLSGGQRAQLALTLATAKRPELLILDEPVASLDPLARREFLQELMETVAEQQVSVVLSSHLIADLERVCDYVIVQFATPLWVRLHLLPSSHTVATIEAAGADVTAIATIEAAGANATAAGHSTIALSATTVPGQPGAWISSSAAVNAAGHPVSGVPAACESAIPHVLGPGGSPALDTCLASHGIRVAVSYLPVSRYWPLQFAESGLFLALALALAWYCLWRLNRRLS
jgi:ABC transporter family protein